mgnify:CR=1 FL=1
MLRHRNWESIVSSNLFQHRLNQFRRAMQITGSLALRNDVVVNKLHLVHAQASSRRNIFGIEAMIEAEQSAIELVIRDAEEKLFLALR